MVITARKRSLGQGNVFTPVCHSVHREERVSAPACTTGHMTGGVGLCPGGLCPGGSLFDGALCPGGVSVRETPLYSNARAVRILLECSLVLHMFTPIRIQN